MYFLYILEKKSLAFFILAASAEAMNTTFENGLATHVRRPNSFFHFFRIQNVIPRVN